MDRRVGLMGCEKEDPIGKWLADAGYHPLFLADTPDPGPAVVRTGAPVVIVDLDRLADVPAVLRAVRQPSPPPIILAASTRAFHPELSGVLRTHVFACLVRPLDREEVLYWLKTIFSDPPPIAAGGP